MVEEGEEGDLVEGIHLELAHLLQQLPPKFPRASSTPQHRSTHTYSTRPLLLTEVINPYQNILSLKEVGGAGMQSLGEGVRD